jgi:hypothetical protein
MMTGSEPQPWLVVSPDRGDEGARQKARDTPRPGHEAADSGTG